ncbi:MAG: TIGR02757 family protein [Cytophagales bacterium]|nr:TIGR02757 family protein [Cytophagales bacterium]
MIENDGLLTSNFSSLKEFLDSRVEKYNRPDFIPNDPIQIPHLFTRIQDIEIMGLWSAVLAWGQRVTIINKCKELIQYMDNSPYEFVLHHSENDLKRFEKFVHRTFNPTNALYFIHFFHEYYQQHDSLEVAFSKFIKPTDKTIENGLAGFHYLFFDSPFAPPRTRKHIATPISGSACKRINMFLRWMVRNDSQGVDFGIWKNIRPDQLVCPCDVHVDRVARKLGLITRSQTDWKTAMELTDALRVLEPSDPVKYDFALFGLGIEEKY